MPSLIENEGAGRRGATRRTSRSLGVLCGFLWLQGARAQGCYGACGDGSAADEVREVGRFAYGETEVRMEAVQSELLCPLSDDGCSASAETCRACSKAGALNETVWASPMGGADPPVPPGPAAPAAAWEARCAGGGTVARTALAGAAVAAAAAAGLASHVSLSGGLRVLLLLSAGGEAVPLVTALASSPGPPAQVLLLALALLRACARHQTRVPLGWLLPPLCVAASAAFQCCVVASFRAIEAADGTLGLAACLAVAASVLLELRSAIPRETTTAGNPEAPPISRWARLLVGDVEWVQRPEAATPWHQPRTPWLAAWRWVVEPYTASRAGAGAAIELAAAAAAGAAACSPAGSGAALLVLAAAVCGVRPHAAFKDDAYAAAMLSVAAGAALAPPGAPGACSAVLFAASALSFAKLALDASAEAWKLRSGRRQTIQYLQWRRPDPERPVQRAASSERPSELTDVRQLTRCASDDFFAGGMVANSSIAATPDTMRELPPAVRPGSFGGSGFSRGSNMSFLTSNSGSPLARSLRPRRKLSMLLPPHVFVALAAAAALCRIPGVVPPAPAAGRAGERRASLAASEGGKLSCSGSSAFHPALFTSPLLNPLSQTAGPALLTRGFSITPPG
ncbi:hypothetical protein DIPPA_29244 [Diplonema papillatum]|nr:hypothetical protein DIPPA_29244 [Diplonema papillatum]